LIRATGRIATDRSPAIVVGLDCITGLQSTRIFSARGIPVVGVVGDPHHFCARTRLPVAIVRAPLRGEPLIDALVGLGERLDQPGLLVTSTHAAGLTHPGARDRLAAFFRSAPPAQG